MDDAGRIGALQALFLIVGGTGVFITLASGWWAAAVVTVVSLWAVVRLEVYARHRVREDREAEERRRRSSIAHLDFD
jgi:hypothetical protein